MKIALALLSLGLIAYAFPLVKVEGDSMLPTFHEGEILVACRLFRKRHCKSGHVYVIHLRDEENGEPYYIIKRLDSAYINDLTGEISYFFLGDNREVSADSRHYGLFKSSAVVLKILSKKGLKRHE